MAIDYTLKIGDGVLDNGVRDILIDTCPNLRVWEEPREGLVFELYNDLLTVAAFYSQDQVRDLGGHTLKTSAVIFFRHGKSDLHSAALLMLRCVLRLIDHMDNDMVLLWQSDTAVMARIGQELMLRKGDAFWMIRERQDLLRGRRYRVVPMKL
jgi:hypothetical protein